MEQLLHADQGLCTEHSGLKVSNLYISQIKRKCGIEVGKNYNQAEVRRFQTASVSTFGKREKQSEKHSNILG